MGKERMTISVSQDVYQDVTDRVERTGKTKTDVVEEGYREGRLRADGGGDDGRFYGTLGQSLFVAGPVVALLAAMAPGIGMMIFGLGLMLWGQSRRQLANGADGYGEAIRRSLGV